jgi:tRNA nucleotidyltransferase (CCA-adding enzyme)
LHYHRAAEMTDIEFLDTLMGLDAFRRPQRFEEFLLACEADSRGRPGYEEQQFDQPTIFRQAYTAAAAIDASALAQQGLKGDAIAKELARLRLAAIQQARAPYLKANS